MPWPPRSRAPGEGRERRYKTVFAKSFLPYLRPVFVQRAELLTQDALNFHVAVCSHINLEAQHPVDLSALLRPQRIEGIRRHLSVRRENAVPIPFKRLQDFLTTPCSLKLPLRRRAGFR